MFCDTIVRNKGDAKTNACQVDQQIVARQFNLGHKIQLVLLEYLVDKLIGRTVLIQHQDRIMQKLRERDCVVF